jgi:RNA-binding protein
MDKTPLTGSQKAYLRGLGQRLEASLKLGKGGLTPAFLAELQRLLDAHELVKLRFLGAEREERALLCEQIASGVACECVGAVGRTALFFRANSDPTRRRISFQQPAARSQNPESAD